MTKVTARMEKVKDMKVVKITSQRKANKCVDRKTCKQISKKYANVGHCPFW